MANPTSRTLDLLSLLQRRRFWGGGELAARLGVSERTLRRDVQRLRDLGYDIVASPGVDGGYRLDGGSGTVPLLLTDDEGVALAIALHLAAHGTAELAEASVGALGKVLATLPPTQRRRVDAVTSATVTGTTGRSDTPSLATLAVVADACRDQVRLSFAYRAATGDPSNRYVEPCRVVALWGRWYLVAFDLDRDDWRTFRVDRLSDAQAARNTFPPREPPAADLHAHVRDQLRSLDRTTTVVAEVELPAAAVRMRYGRWIEVNELAEDRSELVMETDTFDWPTHVLAALDAPFVVRSPEDLRHHLRAVAERFGQA
jgi:predicted DNA-binding transcriptional regulator YafY